MSHPKDKRRHPRVAQRLQVRFESLKPLELETVDLSAGGLSCTAPQFLAPMTKLALSLVLPRSGNGPNSADQTVQGEAIVVRIDPSKPKQSTNGGYRVALFFSRMEEADRQTLHRFLKSRGQ